MKKKIQFFAVILSAMVSWQSLAQCISVNSFGSATAPTSGSVTVTTCNYADEYSTISSVAAAQEYVSTSSVATDYFTITQGTPNGTVIASGTSPLNWNSTVAGTYYVHVHADASCTADASCREITLGIV